MAAVAVCLEAAGLDNRFRLAIDTGEMKTLAPMTLSRLHLDPAFRTDLLQVDDVEAELATSLKNLRTDYIDVYQLHNISSKQHWDDVRAPGGAMEALNKAQEEGVIRHISVTSHNRTTRDRLSGVIRLAGRR